MDLAVEEIRAAGSEAAAVLEDASEESGIRVNTIAPGAIET